uniref:Male reproductive-related protein n=1 Tax=Macrobrachium rosenbergii TaxID=79674 RepID=B8LG42_MACRS|nr:male reproductive-related protein [Macrobrachium rosenbergii]
MEDPERDKDNKTRSQEEGTIHREGETIIEIKTEDTDALRTTDKTRNLKTGIKGSRWIDDSPEFYLMNCHFPETVASIIVTSRLRVD